MKADPVVLAPIDGESLVALAQRVLESTPHRDIQGLAQRAYDFPALLTPHEVQVLGAFVVWTNESREG